jgi:hypothetical protein
MYPGKTWANVDEFLIRSNKRVFMVDLIGVTFNQFREKNFLQIYKKERGNEMVSPYETKIWLARSSRPLGKFWKRKISFPKTF